VTHTARWVPVELEVDQEVGVVCLHQTADEAVEKNEHV
jgi:hypothetical protein